VCTGTPVHYDQTVTGRHSRMRRVCTDTPVEYEQTVRGRHNRMRECVRVHRYTMSKQSGYDTTGCGKCARVHRYTMSKQSGDDERTMQPDAASVCGYTGTL